jgi:hypothetical protein
VSQAEPKQDHFSKTFYRHRLICAKPLPNLHAHLLGWDKLDMGFPMNTKAAATLILSE